MSHFLRCSIIGLAIELLMALPFAAWADEATTRRGDALALGLPAFAAGLTLYQNDREGLEQLIKSEGATLLLVQGLKSITHERRPDGSDNQSFPSGHAAVSFSAAQHLQMKNGWGYGVPAYALASYVSYTRVEGNKHYWRDVVAGGTIGALTTYCFTDGDQTRRLGMSLAGRTAYIRFEQSL